MHVLLILIALSTWLSKPAHSAEPNNFCLTLFSQSFALSIAEPSPLWSDLEIAQQRLRAVIFHQNQIRKSKNLPLLETNVSNLITQGRPTIFIDTPGAFPDDPIAGLFVIHGDTLIRGGYNDIFSLNYSYQFSGSHLVKAQPFGAWYLERTSAEKIRLFRKMSPQEHTLWTHKKLGLLGKDWGHGTKVIHFSTDRNFTSAAGPREYPKIEVQVPKQILIEDAGKGMIWAGILNEKSDPIVAEFVLPAERVKQLFDQGLLQIIE